MGRHATGIERITRELFSPAALSPLPTDYVAARTGRTGIVLAQNVTMPLRALRRPNDIFVFPGFPPSPYFSIARPDRTVLYVHDVFLLTRRKDLNTAAKLYFAPLFSLAVRSLNYFFVEFRLHRARTSVNSASPRLRLSPIAPAFEMCSV